MIRKTILSLLFICYAGFAQGAVFTENTTGGCADYGNITAIFEPNEHTCSEGYYMPANYDGCVACPSGHTCHGGTFTFNEFEDEGISYTLPINTRVSGGCTLDLLSTSGGTAQLGAVFEPNEHTCSAGYYMPANNDGCVICPANSYCPGGTYTFNEFDDDGIDACPEGTYSVAGASSASQCGTSHTCSGGYYLPANSSTCTICPANSYCVGGTYIFNASNDQGIAPCTTGYSSAAGATACTANTININWAGANGTFTTSSCSYDGAITTPTTAPTKRGHAFAGWIFTNP